MEHADYYTFIISDYVMSINGKFNHRRRENKTEHAQTSKSSAKTIIQQNATEFSSNNRYFMKYIESMDTE